MKYLVKIKKCSGILKESVIPKKCISIKTNKKLTKKALAESVVNYCKKHYNLVIEEFEVSGFDDEEPSNTYTGNSPNTNTTLTKQEEKKETTPTKKTTAKNNDKEQAKKDKEELKSWKKHDGGPNAVALIKLGNGITVPLYGQRVESQFWVPDHIETPELNYEYFLNENTKDIKGKIDIIKRNIQSPSKSRFEPVLENWYDGKENKWIIEFLPYYRYIDNRKSLGEEFCRILTKDELKIALEGYEKLLKHMEKKCETYWKRFKDKINIRTFWADR